MKQRCHNPSHPQYPYYGGRGIVVCERWLASVENFASDMGERPSDFHSIDRIDVNGIYEPSNCRWADRTTQNRNMRKARKVVIEGREYLANDLADISGHKADTIIERAARGFSYAEIVGDDRLSNLKGIRLAIQARSKKFREATHCQLGHEFTPENTQITKEGWKRCRKCRNERAVRNRASRKLRLETIRP